MKKLHLFGAALAVCLLSATENRAQSWKDLFNKENISKVVETIKEHTADSVSMVGTWNYQAPAVEFLSDNLLMKAGGEAAEKVAENKLKEQLTKVGITEGHMNFTFHADSTFTSTVGKKTLRGTYAYNKETKQVDLKYFKLVNMHAQLRCKANTMELLFNSDKLLKLMAYIGSKSNSATLKEVSSLANKYDGMMLGFQLMK